jgi:hypothetical protein
MNSLDELVTTVLREEAEDAPAADAFVTRLLRDERVRESHPRENRWVVPVVAAAVTALIVSAAVTTSLQRRQDHGEPANPGRATPTSTTDSSVEIPPGHAGRLPGWIALSSGPVHAEMNAVTPANAPWRVWHVGCPGSVLSALESGDVACAGIGKTPRYEVMVSLGAAPAEIEDPRVRWDAPLHPVTSSHQVRVGGTPAVVTVTSGDVRYGCPDSCGRWVSRHITVISFPDQARHVTILSPEAFKVVHFGKAGLGWLTDYIYVDAAD